MHALNAESACTHGIERHRCRVTEGWILSFHCHGGAADVDVAQLLEGETIGFQVINCVVCPLGCAGEVTEGARDGELEVGGIVAAIVARAEGDYPCLDATLDGLIGVGWSVV